MKNLDLEQFDLSELTIDELSTIEGGNLFRNIGRAIGEIAGHLKNYICTYEETNLVTMLEKCKE